VTVFLKQEHLTHDLENSLGESLQTTSPFLVRLVSLCYHTLTSSGGHSVILVLKVEA